MYKILLITTSNCEACNIAKSNLLNATGKRHDIALVIKDYKEVDKAFLKENKIKDFPTVLYMNYDKILNKSCGTYPTVVYTHWIKMYFK